MSEKVDKKPELEIAVPDVSPCEIGKSMIAEVSRFALQVPREVADAEWDHLVAYIEFLRDCQQQGFDNLLTLIRQSREHSERQRAMIDNIKLAAAESARAKGE